MYTTVHEHFEEIFQQKAPKYGRSVFVLNNYEDFMPIYEYECSLCHRRLEKIQGFHDEPLVQCPHCHKDGLKKCISAPYFQLKGSGWYESDFKKKSDTDSCSSKQETKEHKPCDTCPHADKKTDAAKKDTD